MPRAFRDCCPYFHHWMHARPVLPGACQPNRLACAACRQAAKAGHALPAPLQSTSLAGLWAVVSGWQVLISGFRDSISERFRFSAGHDTAVSCFGASACASARSYFAGGCAAPCIRGCGPDRRVLAGCAALSIESLVTTMLVLLATPSCRGRGAMRWPSKELRGSVFCAAMTRL